MIALTGLFAALFALVHAFVGKLRFLNVIPRSRWLSFAGGVSISYVFIHILPELSQKGRELSKEHAVVEIVAESWIYLVSLAGLVLYYGLERAAKGSRRHDKADSQESRIFWLHILSFAVFNSLVGYLLHYREETGIVSLSVYAVAMALHFITNDYALRQIHREDYERSGKWILSLSVLIGWLLGMLVDFSPLAIGCLFAFLSGGIILNVLKEELPEERESRLWPFVAGGLIYALLIISAES